MRLLVILVVVLMIIPSVIAVGILVPEEFDDRVTFWTDADRDIVFKIRGDSEEQKIRFFVRSATPILLMDGNPDFVREFTLDPYELIEIPIMFRGSEEQNNFVVTYGFTYIGENNNTGVMGFEQTVAAKFDAKVRGSPANSLNIEVNTSLPSSSLGGGGGGYPGGTLDNPEIQPQNEEEVQMNDLAGAETSLTQVTVNDQLPSRPQVAFAQNVNNPTTNSPTTNSPSIGINPKTIGSVFLLSLVFLLIFMGVTYKVAKEVDDI